MHGDNAQGKVEGNIVPLAVTLDASHQTARGNLRGLRGERETERRGSRRGSRGEEEERLYEYMLFAMETHTSRNNPFNALCNH